ncbi:MAG: TIGR03617 family F420-dependent LLM class oxidoreductase [Acidimicrobiia bacterium]|nr:TIGR03617 family F420-dependent LLM class oxidoreductase [Acidimicrobiia bacterium]MYG91348.1 TIGR03617 family F420-dependent LLM class oxidoreductase [Acidimicrobiia bacterium]
MKFDYYFPNLPPTAAPEAARRAARIGYDGFFTAETSHEPFLSGCLASHAEPELEVGTSITLAFPRSPMVMAQLAWDMQLVAGGKFLLGLGTQIRPHITRRFSTEWSRPTARLRDYIGALRAVWDCFQNGTRLRYQGEFYQLTLMTPFFNPGPNQMPEIPVYIAGVGPMLSRLAGEVCDGFHVHPFHTVRYLDCVVLPAIEEGAHQAGRSLEDVAVTAPVFVVTGRDRKEMEDSIRAAKEQIAFYASTPSYAPVLDSHGWDFGPTLTAMTRRGEWQKMADVIPDEVVREVAVVAPVSELAERIVSRYSGRLRRVGIYSMAGDAILTEEEWTRLAAEIRDFSSR